METEEEAEADVVSTGVGALDVGVVPSATLAAAAAAAMVSAAEETSPLARVGRNGSAVSVGSTFGT